MIQNLHNVKELLISKDTQGMEKWSARQLEMAEKSQNSEQLKIVFKGCLQALSDIFFILEADQCPFQGHSHGLAVILATVVQLSEQFSRVHTFSDKNTQHFQCLNLSRIAFGLLNDCLKNKTLQPKKNNVKRLITEIQKIQKAVADFLAYFLGFGIQFQGQRGTPSHKFMEVEDIYRFCRLDEEQIVFVEKNNLQKYFKVLERVLVHPNKDAFLVLYLETMCNYLEVISQIQHLQGGSSSGISSKHQNLTISDKNYYTQILEECVLTILIGHQFCGLGQNLLHLLSSVYLEIDRLTFLKDHDTLETFSTIFKIFQNKNCPELSTIIEEPLQKLQCIRGYLKNDLNLILSGKKYFTRGGNGDPFFNILIEFLTVIQDSSKSDSSNIPPDQNRVSKSRLQIIKQKFLNFFYLQQDNPPLEIIKQVAEYSARSDIPSYGILFFYSGLTQMGSDQIENYQSSPLSHLIFDFLDLFSSFIEKSFNDSNHSQVHSVVDCMDLQNIEDLLSTLRIKKAIRKNRRNLEIIRLYFWLFMTYSQDPTQHETSDQMLSAYFRHAQSLREDCYVEDSLIELNEVSVDFFLYICDRMGRGVPPEKQAPFFDYFQDICGREVAFESPVTLAKRDIMMLKVELSRGAEISKFGQRFYNICKHVPVFEVFGYLKNEMISSEHYPILFFKACEEMGEDTVQGGGLLHMVEVASFILNEVVKQTSQGQIFSSSMFFRKLLALLNTHGLQNLLVGSQRSSTSNDGDGIEGVSIHGVQQCLKVASDSFFNFALRANSHNYEEELTRDCFFISLQLILMAREVSERIKQKNNYSEIRQETNRQTSEEGSSNFFHRKDIQRIQSLVFQDGVEDNDINEKFLAAAYILERVKDLKVVKKEEKLMSTFAEKLHQIGQSAPLFIECRKELITSTMIGLCCSTNSPLLFTLIDELTNHNTANLRPSKSTKRSRMMEIEEANGGDIDSLVEEIEKAPKKFEIFKLMLIKAKQKNNTSVIIKVLRSFIKRLINDRFFLENQPSLIVSIYQELLQQCRNPKEISTYLTQFCSVVTLLGEGYPKTMKSASNSLILSLLRMRSRKGIPLEVLSNCFNLVDQKFGKLLNPDRRERYKKHFQ